MSLVTAFLVVLCALWIDPAQAAEPPQVNLNVQNTGPRQVEDSTEKAVARDYARAWEAMAAALSQNRSDVLGANFVGVALDNLRERVNQQQMSGLHTRYIDRGHNLQAIFYSPDGSAIQLRDTAQYEVQFLDGDKVLHSENRTQNFTVVMTAAANRWKVRVMQAELGQAE